MNRSADPCDDFYEFACGNWKPEAIHTKLEKYDEFQIIEDQISSTIREFLENDELNDVYPEELKLLRKFYNVCLEWSERAMEKSSIYLDLIKEIGGFPALDPSWKEEDFDWIAMSSHLDKFGCKNILSGSVGSTFRYVFMSMDLKIGVPLPTSEASNHTADIAYRLIAAEMLKILEIYGVDNEKSKIVVKEIIDFIKEMARFVWEYESDDSEEVDTYTDQLYKNFLEKYLGIAWNITENDELSDTFDFQDDDDKLLILRVLDQVNSEKQEMIANFLSIKFLHYLHGDEILHKSNPKRFCTQKIMTTNYYLISSLYSSTISSEELLARSDDLVKMTEGLLRALGSKLANAYWLYQETLEHALLKVHNMRPFVGQYHAGDLGKFTLDETLKLKFTEVYEENLLQILKFQNDLEHLPYKRKCIPNSNSLQHPDYYNSLTLSAFYSVDANTVFIGNGILNHPFYSRDQIAAIRYGKFGYIFAHEASHGFDTTGVLYDKDGEKKDWWSERAKLYFRRKSKCLKKSSNRIFIKDLNEYMQGDTTIDEVMADILGISVAYDAFLENSESDDTDQALIHSNLTKEQLFFVSFAQIMCVHYSQYVLISDMGDEHPNNKVRAKAALKHLPSFAKNFKCPKGSRMNPLKKCKFP